MDIYSEVEYINEIRRLKGVEKVQNAKIKELQLEVNMFIHEKAKELFNGSNNTLKAIDGIPKLDVLSATLLDKIRSMGNMIEVHTYINKIIGGQI